MIQSHINRLLKTLNCTHRYDSRRSPYFPLMCDSCASYARVHLESILQDWVYCTRDSTICAVSPRTHDNIMLNPTEFIRQLQNDYYGEILVQVKTSPVLKKLV